MRPLENPKKPVVYRIGGRSVHAQVSRFRRTTPQTDGPGGRYHRRSRRLSRENETPESRAEYDRIIAEWLSDGPTTDRRRLGLRVRSHRSTRCSWRISSTPTSYYVKNGKPTTEPVNIRLALRPLRQLYGHTPAREFGPLRLKAVRQAIIDSGLCRSEVNKRVRHVSPGVQVGRRGGNDSSLRPSRPARRLRVSVGAGPTSGSRSRSSRFPMRLWTQSSRHVARQIWAMVELQRLSGMRPGEVCSMRTIDIDTSRPDLDLHPRESQDGTSRPGATGSISAPRAQEILRPWLRPELTAYLFSPLKREAERQGRTTGETENPSSTLPTKSAATAKPRRVSRESSYTRRFLPTGNQYGIKRANHEERRDEGRGE